MHLCNRCDRDFGKFDTPGKCPLCGMWVKIQCLKCRRTADAKQYVDAGGKCSKCGKRASIPGKPSLLAPLGIVAVMVLAIIWVVNKYLTAL